MVPGGPPAQHALKIGARRRGRSPVGDRDDERARRRRRRTGACQCERGEEARQRGAATKATPHPTAIRHDGWCVPDVLAELYQTIRSPRTRIVLTLVPVFAVTRTV